MRRLLSLVTALGLIMTSCGSDSDAPAIDETATDSDSSSAESDSVSADSAGGEPHSTSGDADSSSAGPDSTSADPDSSDAEAETDNVESKPGELVEVFVTVGDVDVRTQRVVVDGAKVTILFLHGAAFTSDTWVANGILESVSVGQVNGVAVDLPGFGETPRSDLEAGDFLVNMIGALGLDAATTVIISPSMSGSFALAALGDGKLDDLAGFVGVAPSGSGGFGDRGDPVDVPALVVWGDGDGGDPTAAAAHLASGFVAGQTVILENAGHAAYQQQPEAFTVALTRFVDGLGLCDSGQCF